MRKFIFWFTCISLISVSSCFLKEETQSLLDDELEEDLEEEFNEEDQTGTIYYKWTQDPCDNCDSCPTASNVRDNNDAVPDYATENKFYGPCAPGSYSGEYSFGGHLIKYNYTLESPPPGYNRYYTHLIMQYNYPLNRCLDMTKDPSAFQYVDKPISEEEDDGGSYTPPKYVQFYANPAYFSREQGMVVSQIAINGKAYYPKSFIDNCTEKYVMTANGTNYDRPTFSYEITLKNYNSLDAVMNGLEYTTETYKGSIYMSDLQPGCNTLEVYPDTRAYLYVREETTEPGGSDDGENDGTSTGQVMFWLNSDLGCGSITVHCNGQTKTITGYYASSPECGADGSANFTLEPGTYNYSASCSGLSWEGTVTATAGECYKLEFIN